MSKENLEKVKSSTVLELIRVAHEFCVFTERVEKTDIKDVLSFYQKVMPLMYVKGSLLPELSEVDNSFAERFVSEEHWQSVFMNIKTKFGDDEYYWVVDQNRELMKSSLAEDIADIYQDMKDFVVLFQKNQLAAKENAVADAHRFLAIHWGPRLTSALKHIHTLIYALELKENDEIL
ncbi:MAG: hypothetical protein DRI86_04065 [Bacteroidetes bacterium]|nr:MAG: hypothetical protein DRI86_04065 [Bacteroidota bacterium]